MKGLIWDCRKDIGAHVTLETRFTEHELRQMLVAQLDGSQAKTMMVKMRRRNPRASDSETA